LEPDEAALLLDIMPSLSKFLSQEEDGSIMSHSSLTGGRHDLMQVLCTKEHPRFLFLDDLQWAESANLELLSAVLLKKPIEYFFVTLYRSNKVLDGHHFLCKHIFKLDSKRAIQQIPLSNFSPQHIGAFIAETL
jgi:predicted ATPase